MGALKLICGSIGFFHFATIIAMIHAEKAPKLIKKLQPKKILLEPIEECRKNYSISPNASVTFNLDHEYCIYSIVGPKTPKCTAEIICTRMNFEPGDCSKKFFELSDASKGELRTCNVETFKTPYRGFGHGSSFLVTYSGPINNTNCTVSCVKPQGKSRYFKTLLQVLDKEIEDSCVCGKINSQQDRIIGGQQVGGQQGSGGQQGRIIGGNEVSKFEFPWLAALVFKDSREVFCGASLINNEYLLSAAHCFYPDMTPDLFEIVLHSHVMDLGLNDLYNESALPGQPGSIWEVEGLKLKNYTDEDESSIRLIARDVLLHPQFDDILVDYDLALIRLEKPVDLKNPVLGTVCLPSQRQKIEYSRRRATVAGWGRPLERAGAGNRILQKIDIPLYYNRKCRRLINELTPRMICGGYLEGGKDACVGDSGGPLFYRINQDQYRQIGVVSFGIGCALENFPGIYTNIQEMIPWIYENTNGSLWCKDKMDVDLEPAQSLDRVERATPTPDYRDEAFENRRDSSWSGKHDPDPNTEVDEIDCAGEWDDLAYEESIKFKLNQKSCNLNILGSKAEKCSAEIVCTDLNFKEPKNKKCQTDSFMKITDSLGGSMTVCGKSKFGGPFRASKNGRDLYITYNGPSNGTVCQVICGQDRQVPEYIPLLNVKRRKREESCHCGIKPNIKGRVIGGKNASPFEFPWIAAIAYKTTRMQFCGGSLINDRYILTAAHCFHNNGVAPEDIDILLHAHILDLNVNNNYEENAPAGSPGSVQEVPGLNERNYTDAEEETLRLEVEDIFVHPLWNFRALDYDISLIKLKKPLNLKNTRLYNPVCLPPEGKYFGYANKTATVAGWGKPHELAGAASRILQKASMPVLFSKKCRRLFDPAVRNMTARMMCAGFMEGGIDSCVGDSGGPLTFKFNENQHRQIGVVSFGQGCARAANPGVYSNIQEAIQWIFHMADDAVWCLDLVKNSTTIKKAPPPKVIAPELPFESI